MFLIRYDELFLKSPPVMRSFRDRLVTNLYARLEKGIRIRKANGRIIVETDKDITGVLDRTFGVVSYSRCAACEKNIVAMKIVAEKIAKSFRANDTFAISAMRADKEFPLTSQQIKEQLGAHVSVLGFRVNPVVPKKTIHVEIRDKCYMYSKIIPGPGGMPYGTAGKFIAEIKSKNDMKAALRLMKRGAEIIPLIGSRHIEELGKWVPYPIKAKSIEEALKENPLAFASGRTTGEIKDALEKGMLEKTRFGLPVFYPLAGS